MKAEGSSKFKVPEGSAMGRERWGGTYPLDRGHGDKSEKGFKVQGSKFKVEALKRAWTTESPRVRKHYMCNYRVLPCFTVIW